MAWSSMIKLLANRWLHAKSQAKKEAAAPKKTNRSSVRKTDAGGFGALSRRFLGKDVFV